MEVEHPIPQQISAYQFRLVGDMTLKQFFQVAAGALISLVLYASGMPSYVKWPLIVVSFLAGVAFAFFPLQDRPLSTWIGLFLKAIYSPTLFFWKKGSETRQFFLDESAALQPALATQPATQTTAAIKGVIEKEEKKLEEGEKEFLTKVEAHMTEPAVASVQPQTIQKIPEVMLPTHPGAKVQVPHDKPSKVAHKKHKKEDRKERFEEKKGVHITPSITPSKGAPSTDAKQVQFSPEAAPPAPPTKPNVIVGQVIDSEKNIVDSAILEIKDSDGRPVRALKSNKLGHFMIVTPLIDGSYEITTEKEGYIVEPLKFQAKGEIIPPIAVIVTKESKENSQKDIYRN